MRKNIIRFMMIAATAVSATAITTIAQAQTTDTAAWVNKLNLGGDMRLRASQQDVGAGSNTAGYLRARVMLGAKVNENLNANFRLATTGASSNTVSTANQDWASARQPFYVDTASLDYKVMDGLVVTGGRAANPFFTGGKNEMVWGVDVMMDGLNVKWAQEMGMFKPFVTLGYNVWKERGNNTPDVNMTGAQIGTAFKSDSMYATLAAAYYNHTNVKGLAAAGAFGLGTTAASNANGNTLVGGTNYAFDYGLTNIEFEIGTDAMFMPLALYAGYVTNGNVDSDKDGYLAGIRAGRLKEPGNWTLDLWYKDVKKDAILAAFTDATTLQSSDTKGMRATIQYQIAQGNVLALTGAWGSQLVSTSNDTGYRRFLVEYLASF